jgi:endonuclease-3
MKRKPAKNASVTSGKQSTRRPAATGSRRESFAARQERARAICRALEQIFPNVTCALQHRNAYELLAATILSAQCTDERVNLVTPALFARYPNVAALAAAEQSEVEELIRSTGFFRAKAENLRGMARGVVERFGGEIPQTLEELVTLPGVGRKTANVLLGTWHGIASGVVVDTHVKRISRLLGLTRGDTPEKIEAELQKLLPEDEWIDFSHRLIHHGRQTCIARRPRCEACQLLPLCQRRGLPPLTAEPVSPQSRE